TPPSTPLYTLALHDALPILAVDMSWLGDSIPADELKKLQAAATDRPAVQQTFGIQARNLARLNAAGVKIAFGTDGNIPWAHHVRSEEHTSELQSPYDIVCRL